MPCFVCAVRPAHRLVQQADVRHHRMVDQRSDGRQDASPRDVRRKRTSRGKRHAGCHIDHPGRRFRRLPVGDAHDPHRPQIPAAIRHAVQGGHRRRETHRPAAQGHRGVQVCDPQTAVYLQRQLVAAERRDDRLCAHRRDRLFGLCRRQLHGTEPQNKRHGGYRRQMDAFGRRAHAPIHRGQHRPPGR